MIERHFGIIALLFLTMPELARADNCSSLSDCFSTVKAGLEAMLGVSAILLLPELKKAIRKIFDLLTPMEPVIEILGTTSKAVKNFEKQIKNAGTNRIPNVVLTIDENLSPAENSAINIARQAGSGYITGGDITGNLATQAAYMSNPFNRAIAQGTQDDLHNYFPGSFSPKEKTDPIAFLKLISINDEKFTVKDGAKSSSINLRTGNVEGTYKVADTTFTIGTGSGASYFSVKLGVVSLTAKRDAHGVWTFKK